MTRFTHSLIGLGAATVLIATALAGCGRTPGPTGPGMTAWNRSAPLGARAEGDDAPADPGGLRPLPKVTPTPPPAAGDSGPAPAPTEVDRFHGLLRNYGYGGSKGQMMAAIEAVTHQYPQRWDPRVDTLQHWEWWRRTLDGSTNGDVVADNPNDYVQQAVDLARYRFDVEYYVWVSKQTPSQVKKGGVPPLVDFNEDLPIVKSIAGEGLIVQISPRGTVLDYLQVPMAFKRDLNHLILIPDSLY